MTEELLAKLQHLIDRQEINDCIHRYTRGLDRHDDELLRSVFHPDAIDNHAHVAGGRYLDRLEKRDGEWRIALRRLVVDSRYITDGSVFGDWDGYPKGAQDTSDISYERPLGLPDELLAAMR